MGFCIKISGLRCHVRLLSLIIASCLLSSGVGFAATDQGQLVLRSDAGFAAAAFHGTGDLSLRGNLSENVAMISRDSLLETWTIENDSGQILALVESAVKSSGDVLGHMQITGSILADQDPFVIPANAVFTYENESGNVVAALDASGNLSLKGQAIENNTVDPVDFLPLTVSSPSSGDLIPRGDSTRIVWQSVGDIGPTVNIFVLGGASTTLQALAVPNTGSFDLFFPTSLEPRADYQVLVISTQNGSIFDISEPFEIVPNNTSVEQPWQMME